MQIRQDLECLNWPDLVEIQISDPRRDFVIYRFEQLNLHGAFDGCRFGRCRQLASYNVFFFFMYGEYFPRPVNHSARQCSKPRDLDPITLIGSSGLNLSEE